MRLSDFKEAGNLEQEQGVARGALRVGPRDEMSGGVPKGVVQ